MNKNKQNNIITQYTDQQKGLLLYQSVLKVQNIQNNLSSGLLGKQNICIYQKLIAFKNRNKCILYHYDLKFGINDNCKIYFQNQSGGSIQFTLPNNDVKKWQETLKKHLNQRGFHKYYKPIKKIGKGNFASVYLAQNIESNIKYAVKAFSKETAYSEDKGKQCLVKQIEIMRNIGSNKNLMELEEVYQSENSLYIVFELMEGGQLEDLIKANRNKFKSKDIKSILEDLLEGLRHLHSKKIMHRDLKPQNILLRQNQQQQMQCVIADFGLAQFQQQEEYLFVRCGTPGFVAPQVINTKSKDSKYHSSCDMFSLGAIFHILLYGINVFNEKQYDQVVAANRACKFTIQQNQSIYAESSKECIDLLKKMLKVSAEERITPEQALVHPYFKQQEKQQETISMTQKQQQKTIVTLQFKNRKILKKLQNDSCLEFKFNNNPIFNGKIQTIKQNQPTKVSMMGSVINVTRHKQVKVSKFSKQLQQRQKYQQLTEQNEQ